MYQVLGYEKEKTEAMVIPAPEQLIVDGVSGGDRGTQLGPYPWHIEVPRRRFKSEPELPAYTTATAMWDLSSVCDLHHSSWQHRIINPLSEARDRTCNLMVPSPIH